MQRVYAHLRLVDLLLPDTGSAEPHLVEARLLSERLALPQVRLRLNERLGRLRRLQGDYEEALAALEEAIDEIERLRDTVTHESARTSFLRDKIGAYEELLKVHLSRESDPRRVFAVAERAKSRGSNRPAHGRRQGAGQDRRRTLAGTHPKPAGRPQRHL